MPTFSENWFDQNVPQWVETFQLLKWNPASAKTVIEVGSFEGKSTLWILQNLLQCDDSEIHCIDTFGGGIEHNSVQKDGLFERFRDNILSSNQHRKVRVHRGLSWRMLAQLIEQNIKADFIYIDASHQAPDVLDDLVFSFKLLKIGGVMICDDYLWRMPGSTDILHDPKISIDAFTNIFRQKIRIPLNQRLKQLIIIKAEE